MSDQQVTHPISIQQPSADIDIENTASQVEACDSHLKSWRQTFKQKENAYDDHLIQYERKVKELETSILDLKLGINSILGNFEGVSDIERAKNMEAKKSHLLQHTQHMDQEINTPINEFADMVLNRENTISDHSMDSVETKDTIGLAFYQSLGIKMQPMTKDGELTMKLVSYHKPAICGLTLNDGDDHFINAQKIWESIS